MEKNPKEIIESKRICETKRTHWKLKNLETEIVYEKLRGFFIN